jgi:hypothetical protein
MLIAGVQRGREPGQIFRYRWQSQRGDAEELQARIREAGAGVIDLDHLLLIADHFEALPEEVEVLELEPVDAGCGDRLSPRAADRLREVLADVRREVLARAGHAYRGGTP